MGDRSWALALLALVGCGTAPSEPSRTDAPTPVGDAAPRADAPQAAADARVAADARPGVVDARISVDAPPATRPDAGTTAAVWLTGVDLAGAEFGAGALPGTYGTDYIYPNAGEIDYFMGKGLGIFRVAFLWERLQPSLGGALDSTELARLDTLVNDATGKHAAVLLDPHNYARYQGNVIGTAQLSDAHFADFWRRLATHYAGNPRVLLGLMNEPHDMPTENWLAAANAAIAAIRDAGATNLILVPGNAWTGAWSWSQTFYGTANAVVMLGVVDPMNNYAYEVHQYLDSDGSGTHAECVSTTIGAERLAGFTKWLRDHGRRGFLGEFAGANNSTCQAAVAGLLGHIDANRDVWIGWSWWAGGPWWGGYMFTLEPTSGTDAPQLAWLLAHLI